MTPASAGPPIAPPTARVTPAELTAAIQAYRATGAAPEVVLVPAARLAAEGMETLAFTRLLDALSRAAQVEGCECLLAAPPSPFARLTVTTRAGMAKIEAAARDPGRRAGARAGGSA